MWDTIAIFLLMIASIINSFSIARLNRQRGNR